MVSSRMGWIGLSLLLLVGGVACRNPGSDGNAGTPPPGTTNAAPTGTAQPALPPVVDPVPGVGTLLNPPRTGTLTATEPDAEINLRSQPTTQADSPGYGLAGDTVQALKLAEGEGGYTWYYVKLTVAETGTEMVGWVRGDFVSVQGTAPGPTGGNPATSNPTSGNPTAVNPAPGNSAPTSQPPQAAINCGSDSQAAFFETNSYLMYLCETTAGLRYIITDKSTQQSRSIDEVQSNQGTYIAIDDSYQYHVNDKSLAIYQVNNGEYKQLLGETVIRHQ